MLVTLQQQGLQSFDTVLDITLHFCDHSRNFWWINSRFWRTCKKWLRELTQCCLLQQLINQTFLTNPSKLRIYPWKIVLLVLWSLKCMKNSIQNCQKIADLDTLAALKRNYTIRHKTIIMISWHFYTLPHHTCHNSSWKNQRSVESTICPFFV
jgi:hypothetical protein